MSANERAEAVLIVIKRLGKWALYGVLILAVLLGLIVAGAYGYQRWDERPQLATELKGVTLGEPLGDVQFRVADLKQLVDDKGVAVPDQYESDALSIRVKVTNNHVESISYSCSVSETERDYTEVNGIRCGDSSKELEEKFGDDLRIECLRMDDGTIAQGLRSYDAVRFGVSHFLMSNKIVILMVQSPEVLAKPTLASCKP